MEWRTSLLVRMCSLLEGGLGRRLHEQASCDHSRHGLTDCGDPSHLMEVITEREPLDGGSAGSINYWTTRRNRCQDTPNHFFGAG